MKEPETAVDVKMHEFGRLMDDLLDASNECEIAEGRHYSTARKTYKEARERLMDAIRSAVVIAIPDTLAVAQAIYDYQYGKGAWLAPDQMRNATRDQFIGIARAAIAVMGSGASVGSPPHD